MSKMGSTSIVWKPAAGETSKLLTSSCEVGILKLAAGGGAAFVSIYDCKEIEGATPNSLKWVLDASTTDVDSQSFPDGLAFSKGVFAVVEQGGGTNLAVCVAARRYVV